MLDVDPHLIRIATIVLQTPHVRFVHLHQEVQRPALGTRLPRTQPGKIKPNGINVRAGLVTSQIRKLMVHRTADRKLSVVRILKLNPHIPGVPQEPMIDPVPQLHVRTQVLLVVLTDVDVVPHVPVGGTSTERSYQTLGNRCQRG
uniref:(northern house mosquito) hypothetical protein n=1 Tax=Culex pipiens TaxID=7175 RepID=A0A8D8NKZ4_CULPI